LGCDVVTLVGHDEPVASFLAGWRSGRMHHAWLLAGPKGVGKASFADAAARHVLAGGEGERLGGRAGHPALALLAAGSHPDFRRLERTENDRGTLRAEIGVDEVRALLPMFVTPPSLDGWRVVIVDAADDLGRAAANALLKTLEEPPARTLFLLVSHSPGRLLPTIRSRCRTLRFQPLGDAAVRAVVCAERPDIDATECDALVRIAGGAPGRALRFAGLDIGTLTASLERLATSGTTADALALARSLAGKTAQARYEAFVELVPGFLAERARTMSGPALAKAVLLWEKAHALAGEAVPLAYDPRAVAFELAGHVAELARTPNA
jgi:DNA polymerase-3 subunit delta'